MKRGFLFLLILTALAVLAALLLSRDESSPGDTTGSTLFLQDMAGQINNVDRVDVELRDIGDRDQHFRGTGIPVHPRIGVVDVDQTAIGQSVDTDVDDDRPVRDPFGINDARFADRTDQEFRAAHMLIEIVGKAMAHGDR